MGNREPHRKNEPEAQGSEQVRDSKHAKGKHQKGPQLHAEGQHGEKTHAKFLEQLHSGRARDGKAKEGQRRAVEHPHAGPGEHRLLEDRQQHDEAEKNSEKTRLSRDIDRHGHDREQFQVPGGAERHPELPPEN